MTIEELYQVAEECWGDSDSGLPQDKGFWVNGFVTGVLKFTDIEPLPGPAELEEIGKQMGEKFKKMVDIPPDFNQLITENFKDLT